MTPDFLFNLHTPGDIDYDIETYPNVFTFRCKHDITGQRWNFEISFRRNDLWLLCRFIERCRDTGCRWVGFNNLGFDYPVVHFIYNNAMAFIDVETIYNKAMEIIRSNNRFAHVVWESDHLVKQIDLYKIHHFDNMAKTTSLKILEFNMRMDSIEDLPFPVGKHLDNHEADMLCDYNDHDIDATWMFHQRSKDMIQMREQLSEQFGMNLINCNDVKIGEKILIHQMEKAGVSCYERVGNSKQRKQTVRESINLADVVFDYVSFENPEFERIRQFFIGKVITETKGTFKDLVAIVDGCEYKFGTGGLHMSVDSQVIRSDEHHQIIDVDVEGFYPAMAVKNRVFPAHLGPIFCDILEQLGEMRAQYPKSDPRNGAFKLARNGAYGLSNNEYSPFLDGQYTMSITINGQLLLCMLVEQLVKIPGLRMIQANTDGVTFLCPRNYIDHSRNLCRWWEGITKLTLEEALYSRMFIRDVNSYIAEKEDGKLKRIGAYAYETAEENPATRELPYHKDWSARVVAMAAEAKLVRGEDIADYITNHADIYDFFLRTKVPRSSTLEHGGEPVGNIVRYYVAVGGKPLEKVMPPAGPRGAYKRKNKITDHYYAEVLDEIGDAWDERIHTKNKSVYDERRTGVCTGWGVSLCNNLSVLQNEYCDDEVNMHDVIFDDINYEWYIKEAEKLVTLLER